MIKNICVYCSSSSAVDKIYFEFTAKLAKNLCDNKMNLVYGGANIGLMGYLAENMKKFNGSVIGVIPESLKKYELEFKNADELIVTDDLRDRKKIMETKADGFIALPGGFGTIEELFEILTLKQLELNYKPVVIFNVNNFFTGLFKWLDIIFKEKFSKEICKKLYFMTDDIEEGIKYIKNYKYTELGKKWF
jgi:uncharacterized protein (TIGR00730 family)